LSKDAKQTIRPTKKFKLGPLGNLNQVVKALGKTIRAMADGSIDSQLGARICNGLGIMRACPETAAVTEVVVNGAVRAPMTQRRIAAEDIGHGARS
jgi:hypothetical protein